jgi:mono/diheme cytochrome c family protein
MLAAAAVLAAGCSRDQGAGGPPQRLADTGLYADFATREVRAENLPYAPQYPLWSDGAAKRRWIHLPPGSAIDGSDPDAWVFPIGTRFWKEFSFGGQRVETRYMERRANGSWLMATYVWTAGGDAVLAPERGIRAAARSESGVPFDIPSRSDCRACHDSGRNVVLGFGTLQLSPDRDPLAPNAEPPPPRAVDLADLLARELIVGLPAAFRATPPRIAARTPVERAALGYLHGNCAGCHNPHGPLASLGLSLAYPLAAGEIAPALSTALEQPSHYRFPDAAIRLVPGEPKRSVLFGRLASRDPLARMPPLGSHVADARALALIAAWIREDLPSANAADAARLAAFPRPSATENHR